MDCNQTGLKVSHTHIFYMSQIHLWTKISMKISVILHTQMSLDSHTDTHSQHEFGVLDFVHIQQLEEEI